MKAVLYVHAPFTLSILPGVHGCAIKSLLLLDQLDDEDNEAGADNTADDISDDAGDEEASREPAEESAAHDTDDNIDIPGERRVHEHSCDPAADTCDYE